MALLNEFAEFARLTQYHGLSIVKTKVLSTILVRRMSIKTKRRRHHIIRESDVEAQVNAGPVTIMISLLRTLYHLFRSDQFIFFINALT